MTLGFPMETRRVRLGVELRSLRTAKGLSVRGLAAMVGMDYAKLSRLENGKILKPDTAEIMDLLDALGVVDPKREAVIVLARAANSKGWYKALTGPQFERHRQVAELESGVVAMRQYATMFIPGLLQTAAYVRSLYTDATGYVPEDIDEALRVRRTRQALLDDATFRYEVLVDESVLRRVPGSLSDMADQLDYLAELYESPRIIVRVLRLTDCYRRLMPEAAFTLFQYGDPDRMPVAFTETLTVDLALDDPDDVTRYAATFSELCASALSVDESRRVIVDAARELRRS